MKCPNKKSEQYKELLEVANGNELLANHMWYTLDRLKDEGYVASNRFQLTNGKYAYKIPKILTERSLAQNPAGWDKNYGKKEHLQRVLDDNNVDWISVVETDKAFLLKLSTPELQTPLQQTKVFDIASTVDNMAQLMFEEDYNLSQQALDEQASAEDKNLKLKSEVKSSIKPGVQELFDSNPELANQVYEALGFNKLITSNDRIVFGHPTIGKSYLKKQGEDKFISLDDDYATEINNKVKEIADKYNVTTYQVKDGGTQKWNNEYNQMMQEMFNVAKQRAISENKTLFTSNTNLLRNNAESFDKVINLTDVEFKKRIQERGAKYDIKEWKSQINDAISKIPASKVINTNKYLSDLFITPEQKQQAQQSYSQYLDSVFPDSKVKDIVYHGSSTEFKSFDKDRIAYLTNNKFYAENFLDLETPNAIGYPLIVNIKNPVEVTDKKLLRKTYGNFINPEELLKNNVDGVIGIDAGQKEGKTFVVKNPEQIHILGSKQDIQGFKQFVKEPIKQQGQLSLFSEESFNEKFPNFAELQPFEKKIINDNKDEELDIQCKL